MVWLYLSSCGTVVSYLLVRYSGIISRVIQCKVTCHLVIQWSYIIMWYNGIISEYMIQCNLQSEFWVHKTHSIACPHRWSMGIYSLVNCNFTLPLRHFLFSLAGFRALYVGLGPTLLRTIPATGSVFLAYESVKKFMTRHADAYYDFDGSAG